ncbi:MAG: helix-turn-helix transcriptional regulator [Saprospiraceae bacterium]|nr:helix-turn-helix transcriptional regulator [Candidatus Vicinibacter affinis]MBK8644845.1 helix-turn-helix transcriptional regulator [Candidatus Vicinibacter affinis]
MNLGDTLSKIRKKKGIAQVALAKETGITQAYLSGIENNKREPNLSTLKKLSEMLDVPLPIIFFLALDEKDIPVRKMDSYKMIAPFVKTTLSQLFLLDE